MYPFPMNAMQGMPAGYQLQGYGLGSTGDADVPGTGKFKPVIEDAGSWVHIALGAAVGLGGGWLLWKKK